jgi:GT2 family glycosyltransferase
LKTVAVVILNFNNHKDSRECILSLFEEEYQEKLIVAVDNASTDDSFERLKVEFEGAPKLIFLQSGYNGGFSFGNNIGIKYALERGYDYVLLLNNDTTVATDFLEHLVCSGEEQKTVGCVTGKGFYYDRPNTLHMCGGEIDRFKITYRRYGADQIDLGQRDHNRFVSFASCYFVLVKSSVFREIGLLSEKYFGGTEEVDFMHRLSLTRWRVYYNYKSKIWHKIGGSFKSGQLKSTYSAIRNKIQFARDNFGIFKRFLWVAAYFIYCITLHLPKRLYIEKSRGQAIKWSAILVVTLYAFKDGLLKDKVTHADYIKFVD